MRFTNTGDKAFAFRDDAGKHKIAPGESFEVVGDAHIPAVLAFPGVVAEPEPEPEPEPSSAEAPEADARKSSSKRRASVKAREA